MRDKQVEVLFTEQNLHQKTWWRILQEIYISRHDLWLKRHQENSVKNHSYSWQESCQGFYTLRALKSYQFYCNIRFLSYAL